MLLMYLQIIEWNNVPMSSLTLEKIPQFIEHTTQQTIDVIFQPGAALRYVFNLDIHNSTQMFLQYEIRQ